MRPGLHAPSLRLRKEAQAALIRKEFVAMLSSVALRLASSQESGDSFLEFYS